MEFAIPTSISTLLRFYPIVTQTSVTDPVSKKTSYTVKLQDPGLSLSRPPPPGKKGELDGWATGLKNENPAYTTCCIQMSHAINMAFHGVDSTKMVGPLSVRRKNHSVNIPAAADREFYYLAAVDEMKAFLDDKFGDGEEISRRADGKPASLAEAKSYVKNRPGIVVFMNNKTYGEHTEIWTGDDFHQDWMKGRTDPFGWKPVWFWDIGLPYVPPF